MTVINTNYSSLEDAWGENFDVGAVTKKHRKSKKHTATPSSDPLCELYGRRYRKIRKPYGTKSSTPLDDEYVHRYNVYKGDDRRHYYGYDDDDHSKLMDSSRQDTNLLIVDPHNDANERCVDVNANPKSNMSRKSSNSKASRKKPPRMVRFVEPEDEDDVYLQNAITSSQEEDMNEDVDVSERATTFNEEMTSKRKMFDRIYSNVYNESEDETEVIEEDDTNSVNLDSIDTEDDEDSKLIAKEVKRKSQVAKARTGALKEDDYNNERNYLDFIIYMLSGFILIFMMEQFIQIGIQMRLR